jgi:hypothetical protein
MAFPLGHQFRRAVQAPFRLDHLPGGEAIIAARVHAEFDQIGRIAHRVHDFVELVDPVAVPVRKLRHVAPREGRLLMRDRVQPKGRIAMIRAPLPRDLAVHSARRPRPFALIRCAGARSGLRLQRDALRFRPMVDARVDVEFRQRSLAARPSVRASARPSPCGSSPHLWPKPFSSTARMVSMTWAWVGRRLGHIPMHVEIGDHALSTNPLHEVAGEFDPLRLTHLARNGEFDLAGKLGVLADFERLDIIPQPFAVLPHSGRVLRQQHLGMDDAAFGGKIVAAIKPLVAQPRARAVGG